MPFAEAGVLLLEERHLFGAELDGSLGVLRLQRQPAVVTRPQAVLVEDLLDGDRGHTDALQRQHRLEPVAAIGGVLERQRLDLLDHLRPRRLRVRLVDRRQVLEPLEAMGLKPPPPFVEAGPVHAPLPARLVRRAIDSPDRSLLRLTVPELPGQFQNAQPLLRHLRRRITRRTLLRCR